MLRTRGRPDFLNRLCSGSTGGGPEVRVGTDSAVLAACRRKELAGLFQKNQVNGIMCAAKIRARRLQAQAVFHGGSKGLRLSGIGEDSGLQCRATVVQVCKGQHMSG